MAAMMVLLREMDLETDSELGGDGPVTPGRKRCIDELHITPDFCVELMMKSFDG